MFRGEYRYKVLRYLGCILSDPQKDGLIIRLNILKDREFLMSIGNEFHILEPWNRIENFLILVLQV